MPIDTSLLDSYLGVHIDSICPHKFVAENHCAHFVSHVLQLQFGYTCEQRSNPRHGGVNIRVHEIFSECPAAGEINSCPPQQSDCLIFVTAVSNVTLARPANAAPGLERFMCIGTNTMKNVPKKHIGILKDGMVWHYSNTQKKVIKQTASQFILHYPKQRNGLWWGSLPAESEPVAFGGKTPVFQF